MSESRRGFLAQGDGGFFGLSHAPFRLVGSKANNLNAEGMTLEKIGERIREHIDIAPNTLKGYLYGKDAVNKPAARAPRKTPGLGVHLRRHTEDYRARARSGSDLL